MSKDSPYKKPNVKDGMISSSKGTGPVPKGKSLTYIENLPEESPTRKILTQMLENPEPNYNPDNKDSLFWAIGRKFTADLKIKFLQMTAKYGRVGLAAHSVGVTLTTIARHREVDKQFDALVRDAESWYRESTAAVIMTQAREGLLERKWNSAGQLISERRTYETPLRMKLLDWCDPSFNSSQKQEITVKGGAVMLPEPAQLGSWTEVLAALDKEDTTPKEHSPDVLVLDGSPVLDSKDSLDAIADGNLIYNLPDPIDPETSK